MCGEANERIGAALFLLIFLARPGKEGFICVFGRMCVSFFCFVFLLFRCPCFDVVFLFFMMGGVCVCLLFFRGDVNNFFLVMGGFLFCFAFFLFWVMHIVLRIMEYSVDRRRLKLNNLTLFGGCTALPSRCGVYYDVYQAINITCLRFISMRWDHTLACIYVRLCERCACNVHVLRRCDTNKNSEGNRRSYKGVNANG